MELFEFLRSHGSDRFTKLDAFCDLINRLPVTKMGEEFIKSHYVDEAAKACAGGCCGSCGGGKKCKSCK